MKNNEKNNGEHKVNGIRLINSLLFATLRNNGFISSYKTHAILIREGSINVAPRVNPRRTPRIESRKSMTHSPTRHRTTPLPLIFGVIDARKQEVFARPPAFRLELLRLCISCSRETPALLTSIAE